MKTQSLPIEHASTHFLRAVILLMGASALFLAAMILPAIYADWDRVFTEFSYLKYPLLICLSATMLPFFIALHQTLKLLGHVDKGTAFSRSSVSLLKRIKFSAIAFGGLYTLCLPALYVVADKDDAPGLLVIGLVMTFAPIAIAVFAAVLEKLLKSAIDIKAENDLTV